MINNKGNQVLNKEALIFATYLLGEKPTQRVVVLYIQAIQNIVFNYHTKDQKFLRLIYKRPFLLPYLDAGLAVIIPTSTVRHKLLLMSAIIETQPNYAHLFLNQKRSAFYLFTIAWVGARSILKALVGILLVKML